MDHLPIKEIGFGVVVITHVPTKSVYVLTTRRAKREKMLQQLLLESNDHPDAELQRLFNRHPHVRMDLYRADDETEMDKLWWALIMELSSTHTILNHIPAINAYLPRRIDNDD